MSNLKKIFILLSIFCFCSFANADSAAVLTQLLNNIRSMQADFTQTIVNKSGKAVQQSQGRMIMERPGKFRWEVKQPTAQLLIANGQRLWIYDPDLEQVTIRLLNKAAGEAPALLLSEANTALSKDFNVRTQSAGSLQWFLLIPKNRDSMLSQVMLGFSGNQIREMNLRDHLGHNTMIQFQRVVMNASVPDSVFHFTPPANVDVIDETLR
jgi:outer membrane lipoprotein carrier protein